MVNDLRIGDKVQLKSDGPIMTIVKIEKIEKTADGSIAICNWFNKDREIQEKTYPLDALDRYIEETVPPIETFSD